MLRSNEDYMYEVFGLIRAQVVEVVSKTCECRD